MENNSIIALLGCAASDQRIETLLVRFDIRDRPHVIIDTEDADGPVVQTQDWVINNEEGIEFGFEDEASWLGLDEAERGKHPMRLTQIYFYGDHPDVRPYRGHLPFGLQFSDDRCTVRAKLISLEGTRRSYIRDTWELKDFRLTVSYAEKDARIGFILCMLRPPPFPSLDTVMAAFSAIDSIIGLLGKSWTDQVFRQVLTLQELEKNLEDKGEGKKANFWDTLGFELTFSKSNTIDQRVLSTQKGLVLSQIIFYREREMDARGWKGPLPFGILFDDSPELLMDKLNATPDEQVDDQFTGYAVWHLPDYSLQVYYSTIENLILRVRIMAPGIWAYLTRNP